MDEQVKEAMDILQEECAEVIQAVSKINRFGIDGIKPLNSKTNREHLEEELGDLLAMIDILVANEIISNDNLAIAKLAKTEKLNKWSKFQRTS